MQGSAAHRLGVALLALALLASYGSVARAAAPPAETLHLLVHFAAGTSDADRAAAARELGGTVESEIRAIGVTRIAVTVERGTDPNTVLRTIAARPDVRLVEPDARVHLDWTPSDPYWNTDPYVGLGQWGDKKILLDRALDMVGSLTPVTVAVIDTGVDAGHPDLAGVVLPGVTILSSQSAGCNADAIGTDDNSHGTHISGIIAADANNGIGIAGVASNARILPIKALDCSGAGSLYDIAQAITYAVDHGARVINISLGSSSDSPTLEDAVRYAVTHDVLIVAAAGNCGGVTSRCFDVQNLAEYPGASPGVLGVGATSTDDSIASFSTQGPQVGVSAPGVRIVSTTPHYPTYQSDRGGTMNYAAFSGTSQATPFVAGSAALLLGIDPALSAQQLADRLRSTADDLGAPGTDSAYGAGRIDLLRAVTATVPAFSAKYDTTFVPHSAVTGGAFTARVAVTNASLATWTASGPAAVELSYHWLDATGNVVAWEGVRSALPADVAPGATVTVDLTVRAPATRGSYVLQVDLVREGVAWFSQRGVRPAAVAIAVGSGVGASYALAASAAALLTTAPAPLRVTLTNTGLLTWNATGPQAVRVSYHWLRYGVVTVWDGARSALEADVPPGQSATMQLMVIPPADPGPYTLRVDLVQDGVSWFSDEGVIPRDVPYVVTTGYGATFAPATASGTLVTTVPAPLSVTLTNTGIRPWVATGPGSVRLSYHWLRDGVMAVWDGARAASFEADVPPGQTVTVQLMVIPPAEPGVYTLRLDLVQEDVTWFSDEGVVPRDVRYIVATGE